MEAIRFSIANSFNEYSKKRLSIFSFCKTSFKVIQAFVFKEFRHQNPESTTFFVFIVKKKKNRNSHINTVFRCCSWLYTRNGSSASHAFWYCRSCLWLNSNFWCLSSNFNWRVRTCYTSNKSHKCNDEKHD